MQPSPLSNTTGPNRVIRSSAAWLIAGLSVFLGACQSNGLKPPRFTLSPYEEGIVVAVVPLEDDTTAGDADIASATERLIESIHEVRGLSALPARETTLAMRRLGIEDLTRTNDVNRLAIELGVDAIVDGSVTAWDPYNPPRMGVTLRWIRPADPRALIGRAPAIRSSAFSTGALLESQPGDIIGPPPVRLVRHFDARSHDTLIELENYAEGRTALGRPLELRGYTLRMDLFTKFAMASSIRELLDDVWLRRSRVQLDPLQS